MDIDKLGIYADLILGGAVIFVWGTVCLILLVRWIFSVRASRSFFKAASQSIRLASNLDEARKSIQNEFEVYRYRRFGYKNKTIIELCQELCSKLKICATTESNKDVKVLEKVITLLKDEYRFDDEKMNETVQEIEKKAGLEEARQVKEYLMRLNAYHEGIIYEKDRCFKDAQERLTRKRWISNIGYIIGIVGSIASICSWI